MHLKCKKERFLCLPECVVVEVVYSPADAAVWGKAQNLSIYKQGYANHVTDVTGPLAESLLRGVCMDIYKPTDQLDKKIKHFIRETM